MDSARRAKPAGATNGRCPMRMPFHGPVLALSFSCALLALPALLSAELDELVPEYESAKKDFQASRRRPPPGPGPGGGGGRGGGGRGGWGRQQQRSPELEPLLSAIAKVNTEQSINYLIKEFGDADPEI